MTDSRGSEGVWAGNTIPWWQRPCLGYLAYSGGKVATCHPFFLCSSMMYTHKCTHTHTFVSLALSLCFVCPWLHLEPKNTAAVHPLSSLLCFNGNLTSLWFSPCPRMPNLNCVTCLRPCVFYSKHYSSAVFRGEKQQRGKTHMWKRLCLFTVSAFNVLKRSSNQLCISRNDTY